MITRKRIHALFVASPSCGLLEPAFAVEFIVVAEHGCTHADSKAALDAFPATRVHTKPMLGGRSLAAGFDRAA
jgi:hypothetical protein